MEPNVINGRVVLVTGANGGLGTYVAKAFLDAGDTVIGTSRQIQQSQFDSRNFTAIAAEIAGLDGARVLVQQVLDRFGRLDVLAHTVGGFAGGPSVADTEETLFDNMFQINLKTVLHVVRATLPALRKAQGSIVAIGSRAALEPGPGVGAYSASKAAMVSLMRTVALENRDAGVSANVILPGTMDTPANRKAMPDSDFSLWVHPSAVAELAVWLASPAGRNVNGSAIPIYGKDA